MASILKKLDKEKYTTIHNILLPSSTGNTTYTQIDHIIISVYGIFCIETKEYRGKIYGSEKAREWTQYSHHHRYSMMNPIHQNFGHIEALNKFLKNTSPPLDFPVHSIIAFVGDAKLQVTAESAQIVNQKSLLPTIEKLSIEAHLSQSDVAKIIELLEKKKSTKQREDEHATEVSEYKKDIEEKIKSGICPKCGSALVLKKGRYKDFYGCISYPKCRYSCSSKGRF